LKALAEGEGGSIASADFKLLIIDRTNQTLTNLCEITASVCGYKLEIIQIDESV
jgi:elongation factor 1-gamma